ARIAFPVRAAVMRTVAIAAADEVGDDRGAAVDDDRYRIRQADRPDEAGLRAGGRYDLGLARALGDVGQLGQLGGLDLVDLVIAAHAQSDQSLGAADDQRLDAARRRDAGERCHVLDRL